MGVVGAGVRLGDLGGRVADHGDPVAAGDAAGQTHGGGLAVLAAHGQAGGARYVGQHDVVVLAGDAVAAEHDAVDPAARSGGRGAAVIADGPAQAQIGAGACGVGCAQRGHSQVGVGAQGGAEAPGAVVVAFGAAVGSALEQDARAAAAAVDAEVDIKAAGAPDAVRQGKAVAALVRLARQQGQIGGAGEAEQGVHQQGARVAVGIALADDETVLVGQVGGDPALVEVLPAQREHIARARGGRVEADIARDQVAADIDQAFELVVGFERSTAVEFGNLVVGVHRDAQADGAGRVGAARPVEAGAAVGDSAGRGVRRGAGADDAGDDDAGALVQHLDALGPVARGRDGAGVGRGPGHRDGVAGLPVTGRADGQIAGHQVDMLDVLGQGAGKAELATVVGFGVAALSLRVAEVGLDHGQQLARAAGAIGQLEGGCSRKASAAGHGARGGLQIGPQ